MNKTLRALVFGGTPLSSLAAEAAFTALRVFAGLSMSLAHGLGKLPPGEQFVGFVGKLGFPAPSLFAWAAALSEFLGGILLAIGLFTRPAAFFVLFTMGVAAFKVHAADPYLKKELAFLYGVIALAFTLVGAGRLSIDSLIRKGK